MSKKMLVTGGAGFIGHHFVEHILKNTDWDIVCLDRLDTSGNLNRLTDIDRWDEFKTRVRFVYHDLRSPLNDGVIKMMLMPKNPKIDPASGMEMPEPFDYVVHFAASTHVDRSITDPMAFVMDNVVGTTNLLDFFRVWGDMALAKDGKILQFGTDEVFGPAPEGVLYKEFDRHNPNNPYAAAKAGAEAMADAYANTYRLPIISTHCMNVFGERQHPEKFIPMCIKKILKGETIKIHSNKDKTKAGTRFYLHTRNVCDAVLFILKNGPTLDGHATAGKYNIVGDREVSNLEMAQLIANILGKELKYEMVDFHSSRPGHDLRYGLDGSLLQSMGWVPPVGFEESLKRTVEWTIAHQDKWLY